MTCLAPCRPAREKYGSATLRRHLTALVLGLKFAADTPPVTLEGHVRNGPTQPLRIAQKIGTA